jgi:hypothetical protein
MAHRVLGWVLLILSFVISLGLGLWPVVNGMPAWVPWTLACLSVVIAIIALFKQWATKPRPSKELIDEYIKEAEWYLELGDLNDAWQSYIKARRHYNKLLPEEQTEWRDKIMALYGELEKDRGPRLPKKAQHAP